MDYDVVIATRNRPEILRISVPLILRQKRPPRSVIIVDASDDHEQIRRTVTGTASDFLTKVKILHSQPNSALQRNIGLKYVESPVVIFPDDDSLWWPGVAEAIMRVYERDIDGDVGGVYTSLAKEPPPEAELDTDNRMRLSDSFRLQIAAVRWKFEGRIFPDPIYIYGRTRWGIRPVPEWLSEENASLSEYMPGCRMSFRTEAIRASGFDEDLGAHIGWAAWEDAAASFAVMQKWLVVEAHNAKVCHYQFPAPRAKGFEIGFINHFNRAYVICRYAPQDSLARQALKRYGIYKLMQYISGTWTQYGRDRVRGHLQAMRLMKYLLDAPTSDLRQWYLELCRKTLKHRGAGENMETSV
jgi:glycosyltransferase involved in cell wall biosynthesis